MTADRFHDLWTRQLDGQHLSPEEAADLARAFIDETDLRTSLVRDAEMHDLLNVTARLSRRDDESFVRSVLERLELQAAAADAEPVAPPRWTQTPYGWSEPEPPPVQAGGFVAPVAAVQPAAAPASIPLRRRNPNSSAAWVSLAVVSLVALVVLAIVYSQRMTPSKPTADGSSQLLGKSDASEELRNAAENGTLANGAWEKKDGQIASRTPGETPRDARNLAHFQPVSWKKGGPRGEELEPGVHELAGGIAKVRTPANVELEIVAPAIVDLTDAKTLDVRRGLVRVSHPANGLVDAMLIRLLTPLSEVQEFEGTAELNVADEGETEIAIHDGHLRFIERAMRDAAAAVVTLSSDDFDRARVYVPVREMAGDDEASEMLASELTGPGDRFLGQIAVDGRTLEFGVPETFADIRRKAEKRFHQTPVEFVNAWTEMVRKLGQPMALPALPEVRGRRVEARSGDALFGIELPSAPSVLPEKGAEDETFEGVIVVNGELRVFKSRAEFKAAKPEIFERNP